MKKTITDLDLLLQDYLDNNPQIEPLFEEVKYHTPYEIAEVVFFSHN